MKNGSKVKKVFAVILVMATLCVCFSMNCSAASWKTGNVPSGYRDSGYTTVTLSNPNKDATIKLHAYNKRPLCGSKGYEGNSRLYVTMRTTGGQWIWGGVVDTGSQGVTLKLGRNYRAYRICVREVAVDGMWYFRSAKTFYHPDYFAIECKSNCYA